MTEPDNPPNGLEFQITDTKLYVSVVTLSRENDKKLLEQLISGFKRTVEWNKYRSQTTIQPQNNNLNFLIDPTFTKVNRLLALPFARNTEIKDFNVLIDGKSFFDLPVKNKEESYQ